MSYYSVAESNRHQGEQEFRRAANQLVNSLSEKVLDSGKELDNLSIQVGGEEVYYYERQKDIKHNFNPESVDKINTAFRSPRNLKDSVNIQVNNETVFYACKGKIFLDAIDLKDWRINFKLEEKFLAIDIEKIMESIPIDTKSSDIEKSTPLAKDLTLHYKENDCEVDNQFMYIKEFECIKHDDKVIFFNGLSAPEATENEIDYLKNKVYELRDVSLNQKTKDLKHNFEKLLSHAGSRNEAGLTTYDHPQFHISKNDKQWLSVTSKENDKEVFNNFGFTPDITEDDKKEVQRMEFFIDFFLSVHEHENSKSCVKEFEREAREEELDIDI